jgi:predicted nucleic acid-binding protein
VILVDTCVWVDHLRKGDAVLVGLLNDGAVVMHPFVIGELACGQLKQRSKILDLLSSMATIEAATDSEALALIDRERPFGRGLGWVDVHLLASARLSHVPLWTRDRALGRAAESLGVASAL